MALVALFLCGSFLSGCGPLIYTINVMPASRAVERAREAQAAEHAPYEYYFALENLKKAREEAGEASYQDAIRFAEAAEEWGARALDIARRRMREMGR